MCPNRNHRHRSFSAFEVEDLTKDILAGLQKPRGKKSLPSLLLWNGNGQKLFQDVLSSPAYYPCQAETQLLCESIGAVAGSIANSEPDILIELGLPTIAKTAPPR